MRNIAAFKPKHKDNEGRPAVDPRDTVRMDNLYLLLEFIPTPNSQLTEIQVKAAFQ